MKNTVAMRLLDATSQGSHDEDLEVVPEEMVAEGNHPNWIRHSKVHEKPLFCRQAPPRSVAAQGSSVYRQAISVQARSKSLKKRRWGQG